MNSMATATGTGTDPALNPADFQHRWQAWVDDPLIAAAGISFDRSPSGPIRAAEGQFRICAWHIDRDERPGCFQDVATREEALFVCENLQACAGRWNVDHAAVFDDGGAVVG